MAGSSIFVTYGLKSGGGAPFLRRTRNAFGQLQTRTRTGGTSSQQQRRNCTGRTYSYNTSIYVRTSYGNASGCGGPFQGLPSGCFQYFSACSSPGSFAQVGLYSYGACGCSFPNSCCMPGECRNYSGTACVFDQCGGWYASTAGATNPSCSAGATQRQARTANVCSFGAGTAGSNVSSCNTASPGCSNGALQRGCQTAFSFREQDGSPFEEADICTTSSPTPAAGAVEVQCIPN